MLYPDCLEENEYIRMLAMQKGKEEKRCVKYVRSFDEFVRFIATYRYNWDVYCQLATNLGTDSGTAESQYRRKVFFLDFDLKDYPEFKDAHDVILYVKEKLPKLFILACIDSGNGYHLYVAVEESAIFEEIIETNNQLIFLLGADSGAGKVTQIARPPYTFNHKYNGGHDYTHKDVWKAVKSVFNSIDKSGFHPLGISYIKRQMKAYTDNVQNKQILEAMRQVCSESEDSRCYYCIQKVLESGVEAGERNTWHGRIVKFLQSVGKGRTEILAICNQWNKKCRPPKSEAEIKADTDKFMTEDYNLLGCYESIPDARRSKIVEKQCDKFRCQTLQKGLAKQSNSPEVAIPISILTDRNLRKIELRYAFLLITILYIHNNQKITVKALKSLLGISKRDNDCISPRVFNDTLQQMVKYGWIELTPYKEKAPFGKCEIKLLKKVRNTYQGNILVYHSVVQAVISGEISKTDYCVYLAMKRNLTCNKCVTLEQLSLDLHMDKSNIAKNINNLVANNCLMKQTIYCDSKSYLRYSFPCPEAVKKAKSTMGQSPVIQNQVRVNDLDKESAPVLVA